MIEVAATKDPKMATEPSHPPPGWKPQDMHARRTEVSPHLLDCNRYPSIQEDLSPLRPLTAPLAGNSSFFMRERPNPGSENYCSNFLARKNSVYLLNYLQTVGRTKLTEAGPQMLLIYEDSNPSDLGRASRAQVGGDRDGAR